jgi:hypothetical protein
MLLFDEVLSNSQYRQNPNNMKQAIAKTNGPEKAADLLEQAFNLALQNGHPDLRARVRPAVSA